MRYPNEKRLERRITPWFLVALLATMHLVTSWSETDRDHLETGRSAHLELMAPLLPPR